MSVTLALINFLRTQGMTAEQIIQAVEVAETALDEQRWAYEVKPSAGALRTQRWRERKSQVTSQGVTSDVTGDEETAKKVPPITPLKKQTPLSEANASSIPIAKSKRGTRLPDDWQPTESIFLFGNELGFSRETITAEMGRFADHFGSAPGARGLKTDWVKTARNWLRTAADRKGPRPLYYNQGDAREKSSVIIAADRLLDRVRSFDAPIPDSARTGSGESAAVVRVLPKR